MQNDFLACLCVDKVWKKICLSDPFPDVNIGVDINWISKVVQSLVKVHCEDHPEYWIKDHSEFWNDLLWKDRMQQISCLTGRKLWYEGRNIFGWCLLPVTAGKVWSSALMINFGEWTWFPQRRNRLDRVIFCRRMELCS